MKARDIRRRTITLFVLGIAVPSSLLAYLAFRGIRNDQALLERERREDLRAALDEVVSAHDSMLTALGHDLDAILADPAPESALDRAILAFVARNASVDAAFQLSTDGRIHRLITAGLLYTSTPDLSEGEDRGSSPALERVRRREFAGAGPVSVLAMYRDIVASASPADVRADALNASARLDRNLGNFVVAMNEYRRLAAEFGSERTAGGVPFRLVARLELATAEHEAGDASAAARTLLDVYGELLRATTKLARGQYVFLQQQVRERAEAAIADVAAPDEKKLLTDSLVVLSSLEEAAVERTERMLLFAQSAGQPLSSRALRPPNRADPYARLMLDLDGRPYAVQLGSEMTVRGETGPETWGVLLDADTLVMRLASALTDRTAAASVGWSLADATGTMLSRVGTDEGGIATVSSGLPGGVPPLTINLYPAGPGFVSTLLTSRRGIFFYAFVLLAGILVVGLVLTMNTISQQLELARMQSDFVSTVSHEFRSPLTAIRQIGEMLQADQVPSDARRRRYYDVLVEQSERLSLLVNRVLDFARMEDGHHAFTMQAIDVNAFLDDLVSDIEHRVDHEGFVIRKEVEPDLPRLNGDLDALKQAVSNLIDNAVKYSGDSRELIVRGFAENGQVVVAVQDFGKGMDAAERSRVFERFYRGGDPLARSVKGTGLGLTMVKHIVEGHGGHIDVESTPGRGSTFTVRLPAESATHG